MVIIHWYIGSKIVGMSILFLSIFSLAGLCMISHRLALPGRNPALSWIRR